MQETTPPTVIAVDIGGTKVAAAYVTLGENPVVAGRRSLPTADTGGGDGLIQAVKDVVSEMLVDPPAPIQGIGVGSAGVVDPETGIITSATDLIPGWAGSPLGPALREEFDIPVGVTGDVLAHAMGEDAFGAGRGHASSLAVGVGTGIGGAFVTEEGVRAGTRGLSGHIGHLRHPLASDLKCSCGREGHVEAISSGTAIADEYHRKTGKSLTGREVDEAAQTDPVAAEVVKTAGRALGESLAGLANSWDPDVIIISGSVANSGDLWWDSVHQGFQGQAMDAVRPTPILRGELGSDAPLLGAAQFVVSQLPN